MTIESKKQEYLFTKERLSQLRQELLSDISNVDSMGYDQDLENIDEVDDAIDLILGGFVQPNLFNTGNWIAECAERMRDLRGTPTILASLLEEKLADGYEPPQRADPIFKNTASLSCGIEALEGLNRLWRKLYDDSEGDKWRNEVINLSNRYNDTPIDEFIDHIFNGMYPPPEILLAVAKCFNLYLSSAGKLSLEDVFYGYSKKGLGSFAKQARNHLSYTTFHDTICGDRLISKTLGEKHPDSLERMAEVFLMVEEFLDDDLISDDNSHLVEKEDMIESFLRGYRRWKKKNLA